MLPHLQLCFRFKRNCDIVNQLRETFDSKNCLFSSPYCFLRNETTFGKTEFYISKYYPLIWTSSIFYFDSKENNRLHQSHSWSFYKARKKNRIKNRLVWVHVESLFPIEYITMHWIFPQNMIKYSWRISCCHRHRSMIYTLFIVVLA